MPFTSKFYGNVMGIPVGSPDDDQFTGEYFPDGQSGQGYVRRGLPSEMALDRLISPRRANRENGYLPGVSERDIEAYEADDRRAQRSMRITVGNSTGRFSGPPDRVR
jgi:hypothetical protein